MDEIHKLRAQISNIVQTYFPGLDAGFMPNLRPPSDLQVMITMILYVNTTYPLHQLKVLKQLLTAAFIDQVAVRKDLVQKDSSTGIKYATARGVEYRAMGIQEDVFIHPSSILANGPPPEYMVYHEVVQASHIWLKGTRVSLVTDSNFPLTIFCGRFNRD